LRYANVSIGLTDADGKTIIWGYIPIVVAKCGVFLKEKGTLFNLSNVTFPNRALSQRVLWQASSAETAQKDE